MGRYDTRLPENLVPEADRCLPLFVPDDSAYITQIVEHLRKLTNDRRYERGDPVAIDTVREQWMERTFVPFLDAVINGESCESGSSSECFRLDSRSTGIKFHPNSPYIVPELDDVSYLGIWSSWENEKSKTPDWIGDLLDFFGVDTDLNLLGYGATDVFISPPPERSDLIGSLQDLISFIQDVSQLNFPHLEIELVGHGEINVNLLAINRGGAAIFVVNDTSPLDLILDAILNGNFGALVNVKIAELQRDFGQVPPETATNVSIPIVLDGDENTAHNVKVFFTPRFDDEFTNPIGVGGGFESVEICGNLRVIGDDSSEIDRTNYKIEKNQKEGLIMATKDDIRDGVVCALEEVSQRVLLAQSGNVTSGVSIDPDTRQIKIESAFGKVDEIAGVSSEETLYGMAYAVGEGFRDLVKEVVDWKNSTITVGVITARLLQFFDFTNVVPDSLLNALTSTLDPAFTGGDPIVNAADIANIVYCNGASKQSMYRYAVLVEDVLTVEKADFFRAVIDNLTDDQISTWHLNGVSRPRTGFEQVSCYRQEPREFVVPLDELFTGVSGTREFVWNELGLSNKAAPNLWRVELNGRAINNSNGHEFTFLFGNYNSLQDTSFQAQIGFESIAPIYITPDGDFVYDAVNSRYVFDYSRADQSYRIRGCQFNAPSWQLSDITIVDEFKIKITDLGS